MRTALDAVYAADILPLPIYTTTMSQGSVIRVVDLAELRAAVVAVE